MLVGEREWNVATVPQLELSSEELQAFPDELVQFHKAFVGCMKRREHQELGLTFLTGLLSKCHRKNSEAIALDTVGPKSVRALQRFMNSYRWDENEMLKTHQSMLAQEIGHPVSMISVDSSEFVKKGNESVGVARQYCGRLGKKENCQSGVFIAYASPLGFGFIDRQLYLPQTWFSDEYKEQRQKAGLPKSTEFETKPAIASGLIKQNLGGGLFPVKWIGCDTVFGTDRGFIASLPDDVWYFADVPHNTKVFQDQPVFEVRKGTGQGRPPSRPYRTPDSPTPKTVKEIAESADFPWTTVTLGEGARGPIIAEAGCMRVHRYYKKQTSAPPVWLFVRRLMSGKIKFSLSNAPEDIPFEELAEASRLRWPIEQCLQEGKGILGMAEYQHRSWTAWHRHMTYVFIALLFLIRLRHKLNPTSQAQALSTNRASQPTTESANPETIVKKSADNNASATRESHGGCSPTSVS